MLMVLNTGANRGSLPSRCPGAFERTDQRLSIFIDKYQGRPQCPPLFLSWAKHTVSTERSPEHHVERRRAGASGNSNECVARDARYHWACSVYRTTSQSNPRCAPESSNPPHSRKYAHFFEVIASVARFAAALSDTADRVAFGFVVAGRADAGPRVANVGYCGASRRLLPPTWRKRGHAAITEEPVRDEWRVAGQFQLVSCPRSCHTAASSDINYSKFNR
jgi:hypothetical protein